MLVADASESDASATDASASDAGEQDASSSADANTSDDAAIADASLDSGVQPERDAGVPASDAGFGPLRRFGAGATEPARVPYSRETQPINHVHHRR